MIICGWPANGNFRLLCSYRQQSRCHNPLIFADGDVVSFHIFPDCDNMCKKCVGEWCEGKNIGSEWSFKDKIIRSYLTRSFYYYSRPSSKAIIPNYHPNSKLNGLLAGGHVNLHFLIPVSRRPLFPLYGNLYWGTVYLTGSHTFSRKPSFSTGQINNRPTRFSCIQDFKFRIVYFPKQCHFPREGNRIQFILQKVSDVPQKCVKNRNIVHDQ